MSVQGCALECNSHRGWRYQISVHLESCMGCCALPDMSAGNQTWFLCRSMRTIIAKTSLQPHKYPLSWLSSSQPVLALWTAHNSLSCHCLLMLNFGNKVSLFIHPRQTSNSESSCLILLRVGITGVYQYAQLWWFEWEWLLRLMCLDTHSFVGATIWKGLTQWFFSLWMLWSFSYSF